MADRTGVIFSPSFATQNLLLEYSQDLEREGERASLVHERTVLISIEKLHEAIDTLWPSAAVMTLAKGIV